MEKLLKYCLSLFLMLLIACQSKEEKREEAYEYGFHFYQGSPNHMNAFAHALEIDPEYAETYRELSVTYLKRGIPHTWKDYYDDAVKYDAKIWQPWRGYLYLWFYRDYEKAIADFNASDTLTPDFIDAPQGHSVDYWRGIAYLGLKDYKNSIAYFDKNITVDTKEFGEDYVEPKAFLFKAIALLESDQYMLGLETIDKFIKYNSNHTADGKYYKALLLEKTNDLEGAKISLNEAILDYKKGYYNERPYVETLRRIYMEDLTQMYNRLNN